MATSPRFFTDRNKLTAAKPLVSSKKEDFLMDELVEAGVNEVDLLLSRTLQLAHGEDPILLQDCCPLLVPNVVGIPFLYADPVAQPDVVPSISQFPTSDNFPSFVDFAVAIFPKPITDPRVTSTMSTTDGHKFLLKSVMDTLEHYNFHPRLFHNKINIKRPGHVTARTLQRATTYTR